MSLILNLQKLVAVMPVDCGCVHAQLNIVSALSKSNVEAFNAQLALQTIICVVDDPKDQLSRIGLKKVFQLKTHQVGLATFKTLEFLKDLPNLPPLSCVALCLIHSDLHHRVVLVKQEDGKFLCVQAFRLDKYGVNIRPGINELTSLDSIIESVRLLADNSADAAKKRAAYVQLCFSDESTLKKLLDAVDWKVACAKFVSVSFQGSIQEFDIVMKDYKDSLNEELQKKINKCI